MNSLFRLVSLLLFLWSNATLVRALDATDAFTLDLPFGASAATPAWLGHPVAGSGSFATLDLPIVPPDATSSLLITVFFQEQNGGFLRISWQSAAAPAPDDEQTLPGPGEASLSSVLCDNFYEGIGMNNQRSLLIPAEAMKQSGTLHFQTGAGTLGITRIQMEWLEDAVGLSSPAINDVLVTPANGSTQPASELAGQPALAQDPSWLGQLVNVPVTDVPLRIEQGLDFTVQVDNVPTMARIALKEAGLPWGQHLVVWLNNQRTGVVVPVTPPLDNGGYPSSPADTYIGWREGTFLVPAGMITAGQDTLQFSAEPDVTPTTSADPTTPTPPPAPLAVKDVVLQLAYPALAPTAASTPAVTTSPVTTSSAAAATLSAPVATVPVTTSTQAPDPAPAAMTAAPSPATPNP